MAEFIYVLIDGIVVLALFAAFLLYAAQLRRISPGLLKRLFYWFTACVGLLSLFMLVANGSEVIRGWNFPWSAAVLHLLALLIALASLRSAGLFMQFAHKYGFHQKVSYFVHVRHHSVRNKR